MITDKKKFSRKEVERINELEDFYSTDRGEKEIFNLMLDAKLFEIIHTPEELAVRNYAITKLTEIGLNMEFKIRKAIHEALLMSIGKDRIIKGDDDGTD